MPSDEEVTQRAGSLRSMTGVTEAEFTALLPHVAHALVAYLQDRTMDGQPRTSRRDRTDETCPLPTMADKRLFILTSWKQNPIQEGQGQLLGMSQSHANKWLPRRHPVLNRARADHERLPARTAEDLAARLTTPPSEAPSSSRLFFMRGPNDQSSGRKPLRSSTSMTVARSSVTRAKTSS
jgi:hypothetical protein